VSTVFVSVGCLVSSAQAGSIFWTDTDGPTGSHVIRRANADGTGIQTVITGLRDPRGMTLDLKNDKMYWTDAGSHSIGRANFDGTMVESVITDVQGGTAGVAVDTVNGKMYWTEVDDSTLLNGKIRKADLDGNNAEELIALGPSHPVGIAVDPLHGKIYWTDLDANKIQWADLDGSNVQDVVTGLDAVYSVSVDPLAGKIYWPEATTEKIQRANLDGTSVEDLVVGLDAPTTLSLNLSEGKMYWTDSGAFGKINRIERANLADGSGREVVVSGVGFPWGIAVVPVQPGDYDGDNRVTVFDLNLVLYNWNVDGSALFGPWFNERPPAGTVVGLEHLNAVLFNWGDTVSVATVPEPAAGMLAVLGLLALGIRRR